MRLSNLKRQSLNGIVAPTGTLQRIPEGAAGVAFTLRQMAYLARQYRREPDIRLLAESLIRAIPEKDAIAEIRAVFDYVRDKIRYTQDIRDVETLKTPDVIVQSAIGDCDDKSLLVATLLESIGYATRFVAIGTYAPGAYEHVYTEVLAGANWIALETTENWPMGSAAFPVYAQMIVNV